MTTRRQLQGAFGSLSDTLLHRFDSSASEAVREAWVGAIGYHASVARRTQDWLALAPDCTAYGPVIARLHAASAAIAAASGEDEILSALTLAKEAIAETERLLDSNRSI